MRRVPILVLPLLLGGAVAWAGPVPGATACPTFPANNVWHADVSKLPVHARSSAWMSSSGGATRRLHPDFGKSGDPAAPYGIPFHVVSSSHAKVNVAFDYDDESDPGPYPLGDDTPIEGGAGSGGDMHTVVIDKDTCTLYETWYTQKTASGWTAGSGAIWNLKSNAQRPAGWTSADAAGLPILPGLLRPDEVAAGNVDHAIRFTVARTDRSYVWPARHQAGSVNDPNVPPMGARFRLKASYPLTGLRSDTQAVLRAMKKHGLLLADNGSDWFFQGSASNAWPDAFIDELKDVPASAFEAVDASSLMVSADSMAVKTTAPAWRHWSPTTAPPSPRATATRKPPSSPRPSSPSAVAATTAAPTGSRTPSPGSSSTSPTGPAAASTNPPVVAAEPARGMPRPVGRSVPWLIVPIVAASGWLAARRLRAR